MYRTVQYSDGSTYRALYGHATTGFAAGCDQRYVFTATRASPSKPLPTLPTHRSAPSAPAAAITNARKSRRPSSSGTKPTTTHATSWLRLILIHASVRLPGQ